MKKRATCDFLRALQYPLVWTETPQRREAKHLDNAAELDLLIRLFSDDGLRRLEQRSIEKRGVCMLVQSLSYSRSSEPCN